MYRFYTFRINLIAIKTLKQSLSYLFTGVLEGFFFKKKSIELVGVDIIGCIQGKIK